MSVVRFHSEAPYADIAQLVEQLICNQQVFGSSPNIGSRERGGVPEWPKGADCKSVVNDFDGSNPSPSTIFIRANGGIGRRARFRF